MKINENEFKELKQNDRIEYLLRLNRIEKKYNYLISFGILKLIAFVLFAIIVLALLLRVNYGEQVFENFLNSFIDLGSIFGILFCLGIVGDIIFIFIKSKKLKELDEEFFNFSVKPKKK